MSKTHRNTFTIYKDEASPLEQSAKTRIPLARTTRSMSRLSSVLELENNKIGHLSRSGKSGSLNVASGSGSPTRKVLGSMMNGQKIGGAGLKRRGSEKEGLDLKRMKVEGVGGIRQAQHREIPLSAAPSTPVKNVVHNRPITAGPPTPARDILSAKMDVDEDEEDDEPISGLGARFIARPPTPPRPHMSLQVSATPSRSVNASTTPNRPASAFKHVPQTRIPAPTLTQSSMLSFLTPRSAAKSFKISTGSVSTLAQSSISPSDSTTPVASPTVAKAAVSTTPTASSAMSDQFTSTTPITSPTKAQPLVVEDVRMTVDEVTAPEPSSEAARARSASPDAMSTESSETAPSVSKAENTETSQVIEELHTVATSGSSMLPPSRIPRPTSALPRPASTVPTTRPLRSSIPVPTKSAASTSGLGRGLPSAPSSRSISAPVQSTELGSVKRKPSYPSSLGSGPLARPRDRLVSGPTLYPQQDGSLGPSKQESSIPKGRGSPRSVSEPSKSTSVSTSLSASTSRREGLSLETSKSIAGLSDALNKLKVKKANAVASAEASRPRPSAASIGLGIPSASNTPASTPASALTSSSRLSSVHRPRQSAIGGDESVVEDQAGDRSLAAIMHCTAGSRCLKGVVAYVDVHSADGDDASPIFAEMLKSLGARVLSRLTENVTHIVFKSGKPQTLAWYRKQEEDERPHIVGISWVTRSKEKGEKLDEAAFLVKVEEEDIFQKRRKSMEPKALAQSTASARPSLADTSLNLASMRRRSLMYAPKISSPLKTAFRSLRDEDE